MKDLNKMTRKEIAEELYYTHYLPSGTTPIGRHTPLSKNEFVQRYLRGIGGTKGFSKDALISLATQARKKQKNRSVKR